MRGSLCNLYWMLPHGYKLKDQLTHKVSNARFAIQFVLDVTPRLQIEGSTHNSNSHSNPPADHATRIVQIQINYANQDWRDLVTQVHINVTRWDAMIDKKEELKGYCHIKFRSNSKQIKSCRMGTTGLIFESIFMTKQFQCSNYFMWISWFFNMSQILKKKTNNSLTLIALLASFHIWKMSVKHILKIFYVHQRFCYCFNCFEIVLKWIGMKRFEICFYN